MNLLAPLISGLLVAVLCIGSIMLGYWMGRNSIERPMRSDNNPRPNSQGLPDDPGQDPYEYALSDDEDVRISTMK
jgi:hypothetical protein